MRRTRSAGAIALSLLFLLGACRGQREAGPPPAPAERGFPLTLTDDEGARLTLQAPPRRIVTFAPSHTEIVFALGLGDRLVGVSGKYDNYPAAARRIPEVGGAGEFGVDPNVEKVASLQPDLFLAIAGGEHWKQRLRRLGIPVATLDATSYPDLLEDIRTVGRLTGAEEEAERLTAEMSGRVEGIQAQIRDAPSVSCFFEVGFGPPLFTVGPGSFIFDLLELAGCDPVTSSAKSPYPQWSVEALLQEDPEVYLVSSESGGTVSAVARRPGFAALSAVREGRVVLVDSDLVSRPGPRVVQGLRLLARALHPQAFS